MVKVLVGCFSFFGGDSELWVKQFPWQQVLRKVLIGAQQVVSKQGLCPCSNLLVPVKHGHDFILFLQNPLAEQRITRDFLGVIGIYGRAHHMSNPSPCVQPCLKSTLKLPLQQPSNLQPNVLKQKPTFTANIFYPTLFPPLFVCTATHCGIRSRYFTAPRAFLVPRGLPCVATPHSNYQ